MSDTGSLTAGVSGRYATALFELAREEGGLDALEADLQTLKAAIAESDDLRTLIHSPIYSRAEQARAMGAVAEKMGLGPLTANTAQLMASRRRLFALPKTVDAVLGLIADDRGEVTAEVTAAHALSDEQRDALAAALKEAVGKDVKIETTVDESLIGGLVVKLGSRMIDTSIRAKLMSLKNAMKEVG